LAILRSKLARSSGSNGARSEQANARVSSLSVMCRAEVPISGAPAFYVSWETERYTPSPDNRFVTFWVAFIGRRAGVSIFSPAFLLTTYYSKIG